MVSEIDTLGISYSDNNEITSEFLPLIELEFTETARILKEIKQTKLDLILAQSQFINIIQLDDIEMNYILKYSLWFSACMIYMRCFNKSDGRKYKLSIDKNINLLDEKYKTAHHEIKKYRNTYMAHAGINKYEKASILAVLDFDCSKILGLSSYFSREFIPNNKSITLYSELSSALIKQVSEDEIKITTELKNELNDLQTKNSNINFPKHVGDSIFKGEFYFLLSKKEIDENNNYSEALNYITKAIYELPDEWELYWNRSIIYNFLGDNESSIKDKLTAEKLRKC